MIRSILSLSVVFSLLVASVAPSVALADAGFQFAVPDRNFPDDPVAGARVSIFWGNNDRTKAFDLGLISMSETRVRSGFGLIWGISRVTERSDGAVTLSFVNYHTGTDKGMNGAFINLVNDTTAAFNLGFVQIADGATSFDLGGVNVSKQSKVQLGFINITKEITGFQFGFLNMAENGIFPIFPFFNYPKRN